MGVIADRLSKRGLLLTTQVLAMLQAFGLAALVLGQAVQLWQVYVLAALLGMTTAIGQPAQRALPSELVPPALGGLALFTIGVGGCFLLNGVSYLFVIAALAMLRPLPAGRRPGSRRNLVREIDEAVRYVWRTPDLAFPLLLVGVVGTFGYNFTVVLPLLARSEGHGELGLGLFNACLGIGAVVGSLLLATCERPTRRAELFAALGFSLGLAALTAVPWYPATLLLLVVQGLAGVAFTTGASTSLQLASPTPLRGRVMSWYSLLFVGSTPLGATLTGAVAEASDVRLALALDSAGCLLGVLLGLIYLLRLIYLRRSAARATPPAVAPEGGARGLC